MKYFITGGTGTLGFEIVKQLIADQQNEVVVYSRTEQNQFEMSNNLKANCNIKYILGDVQDQDKLENSMLGCDYVIHAAAMKHIGIAEKNPEECIMINCYGTLCVANACKAANIKKAILISTDKAVNPICIYGASKAACEKLFIAYNNFNCGCLYFVCRSGNIYGSKGSVIPFWKNLAAQNKPLPVTDSDMIRYWITVDKLAEFILKCIDMADGGEIFIPECKKKKIIDMALEISPNIEITKPRKGERIEDPLYTEYELLKIKHIDNFGSIIK